MFQVNPPASISPRFDRDLKPEEKLILVMDLFHSLFTVKLLSGFPEPYYRAAKGLNPAEICFRQDYLNSCFHEIAHWCIAGEGRRRQDDYGYWYLPDGRDDVSQEAFFNVEAGPQALEWIFAAAADETFQISCDNLAGGAQGDTLIKQNIEFMGRVQEKLDTFLAKGLPPRGELFLARLMAIFHPEVGKPERGAWLAVQTRPDPLLQRDSFSRNP